MKSPFKSLFHDDEVCSSVCCWLNEVFVFVKPRESDLIHFPKNVAPWIRWWFHVAWKHGVILSLVLQLMSVKFPEPGWKLSTPVTPAATVGQRGVLTGSKHTSKTSATSNQRDTHSDEGIVKTPELPPPPTNHTRLIRPLAPSDFALTVTQSALHFVPPFFQNNHLVFYFFSFFFFF